MPTRRLTPSSPPPSQVGGFFFAHQPKGNSMRMYRYVVDMLYSLAATVALFAIAVLRTGFATSFAATLKVEASTSVAGSRDSRPRSRVHGLPAREMDRAKDTRVAAPMQAIKEASGRISNMETNNADFRSKSARDRCLVLMRVTRCQTEAAINGRGYQLARFSDFVAVRAAAEDPTAGPATPQTTSSAAKMRPVGNSKGPTSS
jgi:hypothetical protein